MAVLNVFVACPYMLFPLDDYKKTFETVAKAYPVAFKFLLTHFPQPPKHGT